MGSIADSIPTVLDTRTLSYGYFPTPHVTTHTTDSITKGKYYSTLHVRRKMPLANLPKTTLNALFVGRISIGTSYCYPSLGRL